MNVLLLTTLVLSAIVPVGVARIARDLPGRDVMLRRMQQAMAIAAIFSLAAGVSYDQTTGREVVFSEDFEDVAMPRCSSRCLRRA